MEQWISVINYNVRLRDYSQPKGDIPIIKDEIYSQTLRRRLIEYNDSESLRIIHVSNELNTQATFWASSVANWSKRITKRLQQC